ncbi:MAG: hypothetical protein IJI14_03780 [Anaerolineaceae bacterium]|nr:hypothetical protein [Anaerolineaceae bacterium]
MPHTEFIWSDVYAFGREYFNALNEGDYEFADPLIQSHDISDRIDDSKTHDIIRKFEDIFISAAGNRKKMICRYNLAYILSGRKDFVLNGTSYASIEQLASDLRNLLRINSESFEDMCEGMISRSGKLSPAFEVWLKISGYGNEFKEWRTEQKIFRLSAKTDGN